ncbi:MAG: oxidoreductase [Proteobacteria bacterium]|nr:oxidoreductase [Pseudomonadota bacterium]
MAPQVQVYAPLGADLLDYLARIARFNRRPERPTHWTMAIHAGPDFLAQLAHERPGNIALISGRNRGKIALIEAALAAGLHVLADKPWIIRPEDFPRLEAALRTAAQRGLVVRDLMSGRHEVSSIVLGALRQDAEVFGDAVAGTPDEPAVEMESVHHLMKQVAGITNPRPAWYFDIAEQGEALADIGTHLVDLAHRTLFPDQALDHRADIRIDAARRWSTAVSRAQFREVTGEAAWPEALRAAVTDDVLAYACNGRLDYAVRGLHVRLAAVWNWTAPPGGNDTHRAAFRGSRAHLEVRQGAADGERRELYVIPVADVGAALERRIAALQTSYPGVALERRDAEWRVTIPDRYRAGHDAHFIAFMRQFLGYVAQPASQPAWEPSTMLAKYAVTTGAVARADRG